MKKEQLLLILGVLLLISCVSSRQTEPGVVNRSVQEKDDLYRKVKMYGNSGLYMTNLWRDSVIYEMDTILINYSPLLDFNGITRKILLENETFTAPLKENKKDSWIRGFRHPFNCDREYTAIWYIIENKLYLGKVTPREFTYKYAELAFEAPQQIDQREIDRRIENATGRKYKNGLLFADWVNGKFAGNIGGERDTEKRNLVIINSPKEVMIKIKKGVVKKVRITDSAQ